MILLSAFSLFLHDLHSFSVNICLRCSLTQQKTDHIRSPFFSKRCGIKISRVLYDDHHQVTAHRPHQAFTQKADILAGLRLSLLVLLGWGLHGSNLLPAAGRSLLHCLSTCYWAKPAVAYLCCTSLAGHLHQTLFGILPCRSPDFPYLHKQPRSSICPHCSIVSFLPEKAIFFCQTTYDFTFPSSAAGGNIIM